MSLLKDDPIEQIPLFEVAEAKEKVPHGKIAKRTPSAGKEKEKTKKNLAKNDGKMIPVAGKNKKKRNTVAKVTARGPLSGQVPDGDVRLTANIRADLHLKLKIAAARRRTTIGEIIEEMVEKHI